MFSRTQQIIWRVGFRLQFATTLSLTYVGESIDIGNLTNIIWVDIHSNENLQMTAFVHSVLFIEVVSIQHP